MSLKQKTINGIIWSFLGNFINLGINFGIGIILARLLSPGEFGLIGMITVFITISEMFINSGFSQSLTRKIDCTEVDYSTVFNFNIILGLTLYLIIFISAPFIADFYNEELLIDILRILGLSLIVNSLSLIQRVKLTKSLNFKLLNNVQNFSNLLSGILAILLAYYGFGVWSLVLKNILRDVLNTALFWYFNRWLPMIIINKQSFNELFGFGSKLLLSGIISTIINNLQYIVIGKYFSAQELGFYTRAELFKNLPSQNIESAISSVSYPALAKIQHEKTNLKSAFKKLLLNTVFLISFFMIGTIVIAEPLIIALVGVKWSNSIIYLQLLSIVGLMYPILTININLANVVGRSDLYLKGQLYSQVISVFSIFIFANWGIKMMIWGMIINCIISFFIFSKISSNFTDYKITNQIKDIIPNILIMTFSWISSAFICLVFSFNGIPIIIIQSLIAIIIVIIISELFKQKEYIAIKSIILSKIHSYGK